MEQKEQEQQSVWFRLTAAGGAMLVAAAVVGAVAGPVSWAGALLVALYAAYASLLVYSNHCLVDGRCNVLAGVQAVLALLAGAAALVTALAAVFLQERSSSRSASPGLPRLSRA